jgi:hypothetical protein
MEWDSIKERRMSHGIVKTVLTERGQEYPHYECERRLKTAIRATMRWFSRTLQTLTVWDDKDMNDHELQRMRYTLDDLAMYVEAVQRELDRIEGVNRSAERIKALRNVAGRTPEEAAAFLKKAEELETR